MNLRRFLVYSLFIIVFGLLGMGNRASPVICELSVVPEAGSCELVLKVFNPTSEEICLEFSSGQQYDYIVRDARGEEVWRWSEGRMFIFMQLLQQLFILPGEEHTFPEVWSYVDKDGNPVLPGKYTVQGILTTTPAPIKTDWTEIDIPSSYISEQKPLKGKVTEILDKLYLLGEDGTAYLIENPTNDLYQLQRKTIEVTSYQTKPIPGTVDKKIIIEEYRNSK